MHLRNLHGTFVEPISQSTTTKLVPMFSGSKLLSNNDILLPAVIYWDKDERFKINRPQLPWTKRRNEVLWRGTASSGRNRHENWTRFQRHRLLSMLNGSQVEMSLDDRHGEAIDAYALQGEEQNRTWTTHANAEYSLPHNFPLPNQALYPLQSFALSILPDWIRSWSNAAFIRLVCFPETKEYGCNYTGAWYRQGVQTPLHRMFNAKCLSDVDGNSFSGRYRAFLQSNSLPIKATVYNEWHDDRLIPWKHFVPMDNIFIDLWAILEYLISHEDVAEKIALEGQAWAEKVLREEDMLAYVYRLMLEYARVSSDLREETGWIEDGLRAT